MNSETKDKYVLKNNTGSLWHDNQTQIVRKGKVNIEDHERYASVIRFTDTQGNEKYELAITDNLNQFVSFISGVDINSCL